MLDPLPGDIFRTGQVLNNTYEIEGILGRGGTGEVYRARNQISGRVVALKALNRQFSGNDDYLDLMKREEEMRNIIHDAVVRYSDNSRTDDGHVFLVMDYVDGKSLDDLMRERGGLDPRDLLIVAHRVAEGLVATHARGVVHRDLSPDNIILRGADPAEAVIIDFGIAKDTAAGARTIVGNDFAGKYEYAAPEQLEGRAEARSDLYSLGALLLAAFRGQVLFHGSTPGEMVRRKQKPLDTNGVPEPLKGVIDWLTAPRLEDRPKDAKAVVDRLDALLKLKGKAQRRQSGPPARATKRRRGGGWLVLPLLLILAGGGVWWSGVWRGLVETPLPVAQPYALRATAAGTLSANAPDTAAAERIAAAYGAATGQPPPAGAITLATGQPTETWAGAVADMLQMVGGLDDWSVEVSDLTVRVTGLAQSARRRDELRAALGDLAGAEGFGLSASIAAGPRVLEARAVQAVLDAAAACGPLGQTGAPDATYPMGATIAVTGQIAGPQDAERLRGLLSPVIGDRDLRIDATVLNDDLCRIRDVLPPADTGNLSIWLGNGSDGSANLTGIFRTGENPVVEVQMPESVSDGSLWVMIVDNTGRVFHVLPNINRTQHDVATLGTVENGIRRVRVLYSIPEFQADSTRLAMRVTEGDYGKSEVVAILSDRPLFDIRRPRDESTASIAQALDEVVNSAGIRAIATRQIDARP